MKNMLVLAMLLLLCGCSLPGYDVDIPINQPPNSINAVSITQHDTFLLLATRLYSVGASTRLTGTIAGEVAYEAVRVSNTEIVIVVLLGENVVLYFNSFEVLHDVNICWQ